ncbi:MAG: ferritin family protein [Chloroflexota bacterium]|nr:ferritin family protein [Chloroflexota bacterium]
MPDELSEVLDTAIYKEIASQAMYEAAQRKTDDPGAKELLKDLARQEAKHADKLKDLRQKGLVKQWHQDEIADLKISNYLTGGDTLEGAGLQDTLIFAMKREEESVDFYRKMMGMMREEAAKKLCANLTNEELKHKKRLETLYDQLFYGED